MSQYDPTSDLQIFLGRCDLYFMVHWTCLLSWRLIDVWTSYFRIISQYDTTFDLEINIGHCDLYFMVQWLCLIILNNIWWMNVELLEKESMEYDLWPQNKFRSQWPIFHGPMISLLLVFALKNILILLAKPDSGELRCPATALIRHAL